MQYLRIALRHAHERTSRGEKNKLALTSGLHTSQRCTRSTNGRLKATVFDDNTTQSRIFIYILKLGPTSFPNVGVRCKYLSKIYEMNLVSPFSFPRET